jgi:hypothetical protein
MNSEKTNGKKEKSDYLYTLMPLDEFKAVLGIDDREDRLARFCLVTATFTIEQYCKRKFLRKKHFETIDFFSGLYLPLREYPVSKMLVVYAIKSEKRKGKTENGEILETEFYRVVPDCGTDGDIQFAIEISPAVARLGCIAIKAVYIAGYSINNEQLEMSNEKRKREFYVPADLAAACMELAAWNMNRYRGRRIGMTANIKGNGKEGERFETTMPENVKAMIEPYKRITI